MSSFISPPRRTGRGAASRERLRTNPNPSPGCLWLCPSGIAAPGLRAYVARAARVPTRHTAGASKHCDTTEARPSIASSVNVYGMGAPYDLADQHDAVQYAVLVVVVVDCAVLGCVVVPHRHATR